LGTLQVSLSGTRVISLTAKDIAARKRWLHRQTNLHVSAIYRFGPRFANYIFGFMYPQFIALLFFFNSEKAGFTMLCVKGKLTLEQAMDT